MAKPKRITKDAVVGIYDNCEYVARIYADKIVVVTPYVKWVGNTGGYAERKDTIRDTKTISDVLADLVDNREDSAWARIGNYLGDEWLAYSGM
jgi:hypothetical protein